VTLIVDYASLQSAAIEYLARDQDTTLIARVPSFVQMFEAKMNRTLFVRQMDIRAQAVTTFGVTDAEFIALPSDFQSMRRIRLTSVTGRPVLDLMSTIQMDQYRNDQGDVVDQPQYFSIFGSEIELAPTPNQAYTIEMIYRANILPLATNNTNWLLTLAPDMYLYGTLLEAAPYIKNDPRIQTWGTLLMTATQNLNDLNRTSAFNAGTLTVRPNARTVF
jgi:hypothetical protein